MHKPYHLSVIPHEAIAINGEQCSMQVIKEHLALPHHRAVDFSRAIHESSTNNLNEAERETMAPYFNPIDQLLLDTTAETIADINLYNAHIGVFNNQHEVFGSPQTLIASMRLELKVYGHKKSGIYKRVLDGPKHVLPSVFIDPNIRAINRQEAIERVVPQMSKFAVKVFGDYFLDDNPSAIDIYVPRTEKLLEEVLYLRGAEDFIEEPANLSQGYRRMHFWRNSDLTEKL